MRCLLTLSHFAVGSLSLTIMTGVSVALHISAKGSAQQPPLTDLPGICKASKSILTYFTKFKEIEYLVAWGLPRCLTLRPGR